MLNIYKIANCEMIKKFLTDICINILGTALPLLILQLLILPNVAKNIPKETYGEMQSLLSLVYIISGTIGTSLSSVRLIEDNDYKENNITADYAIINRYCMIFIALIMPVSIFFYLNNIDFLNLLLTTLVAIINYFNLYGQVGFRLNLDFRKMFENKFIGGIGYLIGYIIYLKYEFWQIIFMIAFLFQAIHSYAYTRIYKEKFSKSYKFQSTLKSFYDLSISTLLKKALQYFDKVILLPLLGGEAVSIYFVANIFGKLILQALEPITNVILSYISKRKEISKDIWKYSIIFGTLFCVVLYIIAMIVSEPILMIFYPQWIVQALPLVPITTLGLCFSTMIAILYPLSLKTINTKEQVYIDGFGIILYIILCLSFYKQYGLVSCCWSLVFAYALKLILIYILCHNKKVEDKCV